MAVQIKASIEKVSLGLGDTLKVCWSRDTGELAFGPEYPNRTNWRNDWIVVVRTKEKKDGVRIYVRAGSRVKICNLVPQGKCNKKKKG